MTNKELISKIREEILHLKMKELQRTNGINTGADVYLSSYAVLSILSNALTEESEDERIRKWLVDYFSSIKETVWIHRDITCGQILAWLEKQKEKNPAEKQDYSGLNDLERAILRGFLCAGVDNVPVTIIKETAQDCLAHMPAWSEEDQLNLNWVIAILNGEPCDLDIQLESLISWLKSLRPSWKPSEEQMDALQHAIDACESEWAYQDDELRSLLNDIKKL